MAQRRADGWRRARPGFRHLCRLSLAFSLVACVQVGAINAQAQDLNALVSDLQATDDGVRRAAGNTLFGLLASRYAELIPLLAPLVTSPREQTQYDAGKLLLAGSLASSSNARAAARGTASYRVLLESSSARVRVVGVEGLGLILPNTPAHVAPVLIPLLQDPDATVQAATCHSLGRLEEPSAEVGAALLATLSGAEESIARGAAADAIGRLRISHPGVTDGLIVALSDVEAFVRHGAVRALARIADASRPVLEALQWVADADEDAAIRALASATIDALERANNPPG